MDDAIAVNRGVLEAMPGTGDHAVWDRGMLDSALHRPQMRAIYDEHADIFDLASDLAHGVVQNHAFENGNHRTAHVLTHAFLEANGQHGVVDRDDDELARHIMGYTAHGQAKNNGEVHTPEETAAVLRYRAHHKDDDNYEDTPWDEPGDDSAFHRAHVTDENHVHDPFDESAYLHGGQFSDAGTNEEEKAKHNDEHGNWTFNPKCPYCASMRLQHGEGHVDLFGSPKLVGREKDVTKWLTTQGCHWCTKDYLNRKENAPWYKRLFTSHVGDDAAGHHTNSEQLLEDHPYWGQCGTCGGDGVGIGSTDVNTGEQKQKPCTECKGLGEVHDFEYWDTDEQLHDFANYPAFRDLKIPEKPLKGHLKDEHEYEPGKDADSYNDHQQYHGLGNSVDPEMAALLIPKKASEEGETLVGWHGETKGPMSGGWSKDELYMSHDPSDDWSDGGTLHRVEYDAQKPLHVRTGSQLREMWEEVMARHGGAFPEGNFHPNSTHAFADLARERGHDAVVIHPEAVAEEDTEHDSDAFDWGAGTFGHSQTILLDPSQARFTPHRREAVNRTRSWYLKRRDAIRSETGPGQEDTVHDFGDGWTIKHLNTVGDAKYEGTMMKNCIKDVASFECPHCEASGFCGECEGDDVKGCEDCEGSGKCSECKGEGDIRIDPNMHLGDALAEQGEDFQADHPWMNWDNYEPKVHSLRDPDDIPQVSFLVSDRNESNDFSSDEYEGKQLHDFYGRTNEEPAKEHALKVAKWFEGYTKDLPGDHSVYPTGDPAMDPKGAVHTFGGHVDNEDDQLGCSFCEADHRREHDESSLTTDLNCAYCKQPKLPGIDVPRVAHDGDYDHIHDPSDDFAFALEGFDEPLEAVSPPLTSIPDVPVPDASTRWEDCGPCLGTGLNDNGTKCAMCWGHGKYLPPRSDDGRLGSAGDTTDPTRVTQTPSFLPPTPRGKDPWMDVGDNGLPLHNPGLKHKLKREMITDEQFAGPTQINTPGTGLMSEASRDEDFLSSLEFKHHTSGGNSNLRDETGRMHHMSAHLDGEEIATCEWGAGSYAPVGFHISVADEHQRKGLATELWNRAKSISPDVQSSPDLSEAGAAWNGTLDKTAKTLKRCKVCGQVWNAGPFQTDCNVCGGRLEDVRQPKIRNSHEEGPTGPDYDDDEELDDEERHHPVLYHASPSSNRESIQRDGLRRNSFAFSDLDFAKSFAPDAVGIGKDQPDGKMWVHTPYDIWKVNAKNYNQHPDDRWAEVEGKENDLAHIIGDEVDPEDLELIHTTRADEPTGNTPWREAQTWNQGSGESDRVPPNGGDVRKPYDPWTDKDDDSRLVVHPPRGIDVRNWKNYKGPFPGNKPFAEHPQNSPEEAMTMERVVGAKHTHYHVSMPWNRESIQQHGLDAGDTDRESVWSNSSFYDKSNYLWDDLGKAREYSKGLFTRYTDEPAYDGDVYEVDTTGLDLEPDHSDYFDDDTNGRRVNNAWLAPSRIEPERLKLIQEGTQPKEAKLAGTTCPDCDHDPHVKGCHEIVGEDDNLFFCPCETPNPRPWRNPQLRDRVVTDTGYKSASKVYHVAPSEARDSITQRGLDSSYLSEVLPEYQTQTPDLVHVFKDVDEARGYLNYFQQYPPPSKMDLWEVDATGVPLTKDHDLYPGEDSDDSAHYIEGTVHPSRLKRIAMDLSWGGYDPVRDVSPSGRSAPAPSAQGTSGDPWPDQGDNGTAPPRPGLIFDPKLKKWLQQEQLTYPSSGPMFPGVTDINKVGANHRYIDNIEEAIAGYAAKAGLSDDKGAPYDSASLAEIYSPRVRQLIDLQNQGHTYAEWKWDAEKGENRWHGLGNDINKVGFTIEEDMPKNKNGGAAAFNWVRWYEDREDGRYLLTAAACPRHKRDNSTRLGFASIRTHGVMQCHFCGKSDVVNEVKVGQVLPQQVGDHRGDNGIIGPIEESRLEALQDAKKIIPGTQRTVPDSGGWNVSIDNQTKTGQAEMSDLQQHVVDTHRADPAAVVEIPEGELEEDHLLDHANGNRTHNPEVLKVAKES